jgi:hypothetical protein
MLATHRVNGTSRKNLKNKFTEGSLPTEKDFADLIDSTLNLADDCLQRSEEFGVEVSARGAARLLLSFFRSPESDEPDWSVASDHKSGALRFVAGTPNPLQGPPKPAETGVLTLASQEGGRVGIGTAAPEFALDVAGFVRSKGRIGDGGIFKGKVPADGSWHEITEDLKGCNAFEVMAGVGGSSEQGRYSLLHAYSLNANNPTGFFRNFFNRKNRIRCDYSWYGSRRDKLKLRWSPRGIFYRLQIKSNTDFGQGVSIQFSLTRLWLDTSMDRCSVAPGTGKTP